MIQRHMNYDYGFFEESLHRLRKLKAYSMGNGYLVDAPRQIFPDMELGMTPRILSEDPDGWVVLTSSYARKPGKGLHEVENILQNQLPDDFIEFHRLYDEALVTTRTFPVHLWNEEKILDGIAMWRDLYPYPLRYFRFGEYWDRYELWFGLWQANPKLNEWKVVITSYDNRDDHLDSGRPEEYILAPSFYAWLKSFIERDGLPDPYMTQFGTLDPT